MGYSYSLLLQIKVNFIFPTLINIAKVHVDSVWETGKDSYIYQHLAASMTHTFKRCFKYLVSITGLHFPSHSKYYSTTVGPQYCCQPKELVQNKNKVNGQTYGSEIIFQKLYTSDHQSEKLVVLQFHWHFSKFIQKSYLSKEVPGCLKILFIRWKKEKGFF